MDILQFAEMEVDGLKLPFCLKQVPVECNIFNKLVGRSEETKIFMIIIWKLGNSMFSLASQKSSSVRQSLRVGHLQEDR